MMNASVSGTYRRNHSLKITIGALLAIGTSVALQAQELSLSTSVNISQTAGGFNTSAGITANTGTVGDVSNIPTATNGIPNFTFSFQKSGVASSTKTFTPGLIIDQESSGRRLEVQLPTLTLTFDANGDIVSGTSGVAAGNTFFRGRDNSSTVTVSGTLADDGSSIAITNTTIGFNAGSIMSRIVAQNAGGILNDIVNSFSASAAYTYTIVMKPLNDATLKLGTGTPGAMTQFPKLTIASCDAGSSLAGGSQTMPSALFTLAPSLSAAFANGYALRGRMGVGTTASGTLGDIGISCAQASSGGGGGGTSATDTATNSDVSDASDQIMNTTISPTPTEEELQQVSTLSSTTTQLATSVADGLADGSVSVNTALNLLDTLNSMTALTKTVASSNAAASTNTTLIQNNLANAAKVVDALKNNPALSAAQKTQLQTVAQSIMQQSADSMGDGSKFSKQEIVSMSNQAQNLLQSASQANGGVAQKAIVDSAKKINDLVASKNTTASQKQQLPALVFSLTTRADCVDDCVDKVKKDVCNALALDTASCARVVIKITKVSSISIDRITGIAGENTTSIDDVSVTQQYPNPDTVAIETASGVLSASDVLRSFLGAGSTVTFNAANSMVRLQTGTLDVQVYVRDVILVPTGTFQPGLNIMNDGSALFVQGDLGVIVVPASRDALTLVSTLEAAGATVVDTGFDGNLYLEIASGERFSGTLAFEDLARTAEQTTEVTFSGPSGDPASPDYLYRVNYSDGTSQVIAPFVGPSLFWSSIAEFDVEVQTDRATGVITASPGGLKLRPDYFIRNLTAADEAFHAANQDEFGIAYRRTTDFNSDGILDFEIVLSSGVQTLFVLP